jgi:hypothetical protein
MLWLILGILIGAGVVFVLNRPDIKLLWYDWVILALALVFLLLAISNFNGSMAELESRAAWFLLASFGLPGVILAAIVGVRVWRNRQAAG